MGGGASDNVSLNIFTQLEEPEIKDGIWVQTANQYEKIMINQPTVSNYEAGVWSNNIKVPIKPFLRDTSSVVYNGSIHILGVPNDSGDYNMYHFSWDGSTVRSHTRLPLDIGSSAAVVYNNEIHIIGSGNHYKYNSNSDAWTSVSKLPDNGHEEIRATVYNNEIYTAGFASIYGAYKWNGSSWTRVGLFNNGFEGGDLVVYNGKIHALVYTIYNGTKHYEHYSSISDITTKHNDIPINPSRKSVVYNNEIHITKNIHYKWNDINDTWSQIATLHSSTTYSTPVVYNGDIHIIGGIVNTTNPDNHDYVFQAPSKVYDPNTLIISRGNSNSGTYLTAINNNASIIQDDGRGGNRFLTGFDDVFYFADTAFDWNAPMYYGNGFSWIKFKN